MRTIAEKLSYNRRTASKLNSILFNDDDMLKSDIRSKLLEIAEAFLDYAQTESIRVYDIRLVGSNAAYNYHDTSDIDIHIVTDLSEISDPAIIARLYFDSIKKNFKDSYDITIKGIDVELYVEDINSSSMSNGIYSIKENKWIKFPIDMKEPTNEEINDAEEIENGILNSIEEVKTIGDLQAILDKIYLLRKDSLLTHGETGAGNLVFKSLRNKGMLDSIKTILRNAKSKELSLESKQVRESKENQKIKTLRGTTLKRSSRYKVGKEIGGQIYFHKDYVKDIIPLKIYSRASEILKKKYPTFKYNCLMYNRRTPHVVRFDAAKNFDTAREPSPGSVISVDIDSGLCKERYTEQIWHHKWMWVKEDYQGFNVDDSYDWSKLWTSKIKDPSGYYNKWIDQLTSVGLK